MVAMNTDFGALYDAVRGLPVVDWHNHLDIAAIAEDRPLGSLHSVWVAPDPYKHRAMRICGEPERLITGDAPEAEKWAAWKRTLPKLVGNPLFDWAQAELAVLEMGPDGANAETQSPLSKILERSPQSPLSKNLAQSPQSPQREILARSSQSSRIIGAWIAGLENVSLSDWTPSRILRKVNAEVLSPCVGADSNAIECNRMQSGHGAGNVVPSLRLNAGDDIPEEALARFHAAGCRVVDISVDDAAHLACSGGAKASHAQGVFASGGGAVPRRIQSVAAFAAAHGWTMLLHIGALRETSSRLRAVAGPAGGFAGMRAPVDPALVAAFLDALESTPNPFRRQENSASPRLCVENCLPRTILLTLNPEAHAQLAVLSGSFTREGSPGHVQLGPAWWWCDHAHGATDMLEKSAAYGVLSTFVGMTTDSRSLLSLARHDWFRRTLCKWIAAKVAAGDFPDDPALLEPLLENVCYRNARRIFAP